MPPFPRTPEEWTLFEGIAQRKTVKNPEFCILVYGSIAQAWNWRARDHIPALGSTAQRKCLQTRMLNNAHWPSYGSLAAFAAALSTKHTKGQIIKTTITRVTDQTLTHSWQDRSRRELHHFTSDCSNHEENNTTKHMTDHIIKPTILWAPVQRWQEGHQDIFDKICREANGTITRVNLDITKQAMQQTNWIAILSHWWMLWKMEKTTAIICKWSFSKQRSA